jgi:hypothetical protein
MRKTESKDAHKDKQRRIDDVPPWADTLSVPEGRRQ